MDIYTLEGITLALVGNKCDLNSARQVEISEGQVSKLLCIMGWIQPLCHGMVFGMVFFNAAS